MINNPPTFPRSGVLVGGWPARRKQLENCFLIGLPLGGSVLAVGHIASDGLGWIDATAFLLFYLLVGLGVALGLHRYFSHASFKTGPVFASVLAAFGTMAFQGSVERWVLDHRRHHAYADQPGDVHSPYFGPTGEPLSGLRGMLHSHIGWMFDATATDATVFGKGLRNDPVIRVFSRTHLLWLIASLALPYGYGWALGGAQAGWHAMLVGGCLRTTVLHNVVWAVNSVGHRFGSADFVLANSSRNNLVLGLLTFGDGWHNSHHRFPRSHRHGVLPGQLDLNAVIITALQRLGLVWDVVTPEPGKVALGLFKFPKTSGNHRA